MENNEMVKSNLADITNPLDFEQVFRLVHQAESLNQIQRNIRQHNPIHND
jgi:hypothetical protein